MLSLERFLFMSEAVWYVIVRPDNGYPVIIYPNYDRARFIADINGYKVATVKVTKDESQYFYDGSGERFV
jgi:hypothetical protein